MKDITKYVITWVMCCEEIWTTWFANIENGDDEFLEVEEALFSTLVLSHLKLTRRPSLNEVYPLLKGVYKEEMKVVRSVCVKQKAGNIYCQSNEVVYPKNTSLPIKYIDFMGTMLDGEPYAELIISDEEYLLEPLANLNIIASI